MSVSLSLNMNLPIPDVGVEPGPDWASDLNSCLTVVDAHTHSPGSGVQITPTGLNINVDLPFNNNNLTTARTIRFLPQSSVLSLPTDIGCLYEVGDDLYYNDGSGNQIRITQSGGVVGTPGSISGLVSPASATYIPFDETFVWQSAANVAANMDFRSAIFRNNTMSSFGVTVSAPNSLAADYSIVWPTLPASTKFLTIDSSGNMAALYYVDNSTIEIVTNNLQVKDLGITTAKLANLAVATAKIDNLAVTTAKLADTSVTIAKVNFKTILSSQTFTTSGSYVVPASVTGIGITGWGGGGGGGGGARAAGAGSGAGGGGAQPQYIFVNVTAGETLTITIGAAGTGGALTASSPGGNGTNGGSTTVSGSTSGLLATFIGGIGGGGGTSAVAGVADTTIIKNGIILVHGGDGSNSGASAAIAGQASIFAAGGTPGVGSGGGGGGGGAGYGAGGLGGGSTVSGNAQVGFTGGLGAGGGGGGAARGGAASPLSGAGGLAGVGGVILSFPALV